MVCHKDQCFNQIGTFVHSSGGIIGHLYKVCDLGDIDILTFIICTSWWMQCVTKIGVLNWHICELYRGGGGLIGHLYKVCDLGDIGPQVTQRPVCVLLNLHSFSAHNLIY